MVWVAVLDTSKAIGGIWPAEAREGLDTAFIWHGMGGIHGRCFWFGFGQRRQSFLCVQRYPGMGAARLAWGVAGCVDAISK